MTILEKIGISFLIIDDNWRLGIGDVDLTYCGDM